jgi:hypothetical protein
MLGLLRRAPGAHLDRSPYYDNVGYADLSDFFFVWLRRGLRDVHPDLFSTLLTPKAQELVAEPHRHGGAEAARKHFEDGFVEVCARFRQFYERATCDAAGLYSGVARGVASPGEALTDVFRQSSLPRTTPLLPISASRCGNRWRGHLLTETATPSASMPFRSDRWTRR